MLAYVRGHVPESRKVPLCGNSIATDRSFLARDMPELDDFLHYRMVDVSSIKELARRWYPRTYSRARRSTAGTARWPTSGKASGNCSTTARRCWCPVPGPDTATAREIAARYGTSSPGSGATAGRAPVTGGAAGRQQRRGRSGRPNRS